MPEPKSHIESLLGEIVKSSKHVLKVRKTTYKGKTYIDSRNWFLNTDNKWMPTKKGIMIETKDLSRFIDLLEQAEREEHAEKETI